MGFKTQPDLDKLISGLEQMPETVKGNVENRMRRVAKTIQTQQEMLIPVNAYGGGGDLKRGQRSSVNMYKKHARMNFWNKEFYASFVEFGTGPFGQAYPATVLPDDIVIIYKQEGWVWYSEDWDEFIFTYGMEARQFFYPPIFDNLPLIKEQWEKAIKEGMEEYAKLGNTKGN